MHNTFTNYTLQNKMFLEMFLKCDCIRIEICKLNSTTVNMIMSVTENSQSCIQFWLNDIQVILFKIAKFGNNCKTGMEDSIYKLVKYIDTNKQSMYFWVKFKMEYLEL